MGEEPKRVEIHHYYHLNLNIPKEVWHAWVDFIRRLGPPVSPRKEAAPPSEPVFKPSFRFVWPSLGAWVAVNSKVVEELEELGWRPGHLSEKYELMLEKDALIIKRKEREPSPPVV